MRARLAAVPFLIGPERERPMVLTGLHERQDRLAEEAVCHGVVKSEESEPGWSGWAGSD